MGKIIVAVLPILLSLLPLQAQEYGFIGVGVSSTHTQLPDTKETTAQGRLCFGKQTRHVRTTFAAEYGSESQLYGIEIDYIPFDTLFGTPKVRPYLGVNTYYFSYDDDTTDESAFAYGFQAGFVIYATDTVDVDIAYRYDKVDSDSIDRFDGIKVALHYFY